MMRFFLVICAGVGLLSPMSYAQEVAETQAETPSAQASVPNTQAATVSEEAAVAESPTTGGSAGLDAANEPTEVEFVPEVPPTVEQVPPTVEEVPPPVEPVPPPVEPVVVPELPEHVVLPEAVPEPIDTAPVEAEPGEPPEVVTELHHLLPNHLVDVVGPMAQPETELQTGIDPPATLVDALLPRLPMRGFGNGLLLLMLALSCALLAQIAARVREWLAPTGLLVRLSIVAEVLGRVTAVFCGLGVLAAWAPGPVAVALPWVALVAALALGWSARDVLPDIVAWMALASEGRVRRGRWVQCEDFSGEVRVVGLRATVIRDEQGLEHSVPNRVLAGATTETPGRWPACEATLHLPLDLPPEQVRAVLREAALGSPWVASTVVEVLGDPTGRGTWRVRVRLLEGRFSARFEGGLRERVVDLLTGP